MNNPLLEEQTRFFATNGIKDHERYEFFSPKISSDRRAKLWMEQADIGEELINQYAWATPNSTAIRIMKEFTPLVEIGCGSNAYWCRTLRQAGIDIIGYDVNIVGGGKIDNENGNSMKKKASKEKNSPSFLKPGGPEVLKSKELQKSGRTLFLCYPDEEDDNDDGDDDKPSSSSDDDDDDDDDEDEKEEEEETTMTTNLPSSMGWQCLNNYIGEYVIHVGETFLDSNYAMEQTPWGRSSSPEFQQRLSSEYHCILKVELPNWFHTRDTLSVWKRSMISTIVFAADDDEEDEEEDEEVEYRHIPMEERLPINIAAPCMAHLLPPPPPQTSSMKQRKELKETKAQTTMSSFPSLGVLHPPSSTSSGDGKPNNKKKKKKMKSSKT